MQMTIKDDNKTLILKKKTEFLNCYGCYFDIHHKKCPNRQDGLLMCATGLDDKHWRETFFSKIVRFIKRIVRK